MPAIPTSARFFPPWSATPGLDVIDAWAEAPAGVGDGPVARYLESLTGVDPEDDPVVLPPLVTVIGRRPRRGQAGLGQTRPPASRVRSHDAVRCTRPHAAAEAVELAQRLVDRACAAVRAGGGVDANQVVAYDVAHAAAGGRHRTRRPLLRSPR